VEAQFRLNRITSDRTKYDYVAAHLDGHHASKVRAILTNPPVTGAYERLKAELIRQLVPPEDARLRDLLHSAELGDRTPSDFLRHLRTLADSTPATEPLIRQLWMQRMPPHVQAILQTQAQIALDDIAQVADRILAVQPTASPASVLALTAPAVYAARLNAPTPSAALPAAAAPVAAINPHNDLSELCRRLDALERALRDRRSSPNRSSRSQYRGSSRIRGSPSRSQSRSNTPPPRDGVCWYHRRYGADAQRCTPPCSFQGNADGNS